MEALMPFGVGQVYRVMLEVMVVTGAVVVVDRRDRRDAALSELVPRVRGSIT